MTEKTRTSIKEGPVPPTIRQELRQHRADAALLLRVEPEEDTPGAIVGAIDVFLNKWQAGDRPELDEGDDLAFWLGSLWGQQLVEALDWQWVVLTIPRKRKPAVVIGVVPPERSAVLFPFHVVRECLTGDGPVLVRRVFGMIMEGAKLRDLPPGGYQNVMNLLGR